MVLLQIKMSEEERKMIKITAAAHGINVSDIGRQLFNDWVKQNAGPEIVAYANKVKEVSKSGKDDTMGKMFIGEVPKLRSDDGYSFIYSYQFNDGSWYVGQTIDTFERHKSHLIGPLQVDEKLRSTDKWIYKLHGEYPISEINIQEQRLIEIYGDKLKSLNVNNATNIRCRIREGLYNPDQKSLSEFGGI